MVKDALARPWGKHRVSKEEYTDINRTVSRMLYDMIGDLDSLQDAGKRREWEGLEREEVEKAVKALEEGRVEGGGGDKVDGHDDDGLDEEEEDL